MTLHLYRANDQRATDYVDNLFETPHRCTNPPGRLLWAHCCWKRRPAKNLIVHVYYDCTPYYCAPGRGCKDPAFIAAKRRRAFRNRSIGNKAAWARRKTLHQECVSISNAGAT